MSSTKKIKQKIVKYKKKTLLISWIQFGESGSYEIAVLDKNGDELNLYRTTDYEDADFCYNKYLKKYEIKDVKSDKIPNRYLRFAKDYNDVYQNTLNYFKNNPIKDDGGASVLDCCCVYIGKRLNKRFLQEALKQYGLKAFIHEGVIFVTVPYTQYQGNGNTIQAKYMCQGFKNLGYASNIHYQVD